MADMTIEQWHEQQFLPWKRAVAKYMDEKQQQMQRLHQNMGQLQVIVALLLEGRTRQALLAWNTLQLHPKLVDIRLGEDGQVLTLVASGGGVTVLRLDDVIEDLQRLLDERGSAPEETGVISPSLAPAGGS